jgi:vancomycin aglycone glucosyltransferase
MRVLLSMHGSRGDVEPMVGPAVQSRALGAKVWVCALADFAELLARVGLPLATIGSDFLLRRNAPASRIPASDVERWSYPPWVASARRSA